jgi:hypothetical protein
VTDGLDFEDRHHGRCGQVMRTATISILATLTLGARAVAAEAPDPAPPGSSLSIEGGLSTAALVAEADLHTGFGLVVGVAGGTARGPAVGGHLAYRVPLSSRWSLEPGVRAMTIWESAENCGPRCQFNFFTIDLGIRYQGPSGFVFEAGLPVVAWIPVGAPPHLKPYFLSGEATAYTASLLFGYAFNL